MTAIVTQKIVSSNANYGERIGGKNENPSPTSIETSYFKNVTKVEENTVGSIPVYLITHDTNSDGTIDTATYAKEYYIINVIGG